MYLFVFITGVFFQLFNKKVLFYTYTSMLVLLSVFRYGVGLDYFAYDFLYSRLKTSPVSEYNYGLDEHEIGFRLVGSWLKGMGLSYQFYLAVFAVISMIFMVKTCKKYSRNPTLSMFLYFSFYYVTWALSGIRQGVVISIGLYYLLKCIEENKTVKLILISVLLSLIHISALILIVYYLLSMVNPKKNTLIGFSVLSIVASILPIGAIIGKLNWLPFYDRLFPYIDKTISFNFLDFQGIVRIAFLVIALAFYNYYAKQGELHRKIITIYILSIILYFFFQFSELAAARLTIYGKFLDIIIFANVLYLYKERLNKAIFMYGLIIFSLFYLNKEVNNQIQKSIIGDYQLAPYVNIFNKDDYMFKSRYSKIIDL